MSGVDPVKKPKNLGDRLIDAGLLTQAQLTLALSEQRRNGGYLGDIVEKLGFVTQTQISQLFANDLNSDFVDVLNTFIDPEILKIVPADFAKQNVLIPLNKEGNTLTVAMANTFDIMIIDQLEKMLGLHIEVVAAPPQSIIDALEQKNVHADTLDDLIEKVLHSNSKELTDAGASDSPIVQMVNHIIALASRKRATDIHIEPEENMVRVRFRIDGVLHQETLFPKVLQNVVTARLKIMGNLDVTEQRLPQDGRVAFKLGRKQIDLRISTLPTQFGESIVMRVLDKSSVVLDLDKLGIGENEKKFFLEAISRPHGIILVTGPTGSGKTTTLYAALGQMDSQQNSIFTLEDPVEYSLVNIRQTQINSSIGMTFASGLRALLRQDPDIILVGEIRDEETAQLAIRAALTGHLVLSTLHTNSSGGAIPRLINMGIEPYLLSSTLAAVVAQRLIRRICKYCSESIADVDILLEKLEIEKLPGDNFRYGKGCSKCFGTGYSGRVALYEVLHANHLNEVVIKHGITEGDIMSGAKKAGMKSMFDDGILKARAGICSLYDLERVVG